jgi:hypothetical protein
MNVILKIWSQDKDTAKKEELAVKAEVLEAQTKVTVLQAKGEVTQAERNLARAIKLLAGDADPDINVIIKLQKSVNDKVAALTSLEAVQTSLFGAAKKG